MAESLDFDIVGARSVIKEWRDSWYCYWDKSYGVPSDESNFVFRPPLEMSRCGVVRTKNDTWEESEVEENVAASISSVIDLLEIAKEGGTYADLIGRGDESAGRWMPIAIQWTDDDGDLTPDSFLKKLGAHQELRDCIHEWSFSDDVEDDDEDDDEDDEEDDKLEFIKTHLKPFFAEHDSFIFFCCGDGKLNPVPCFAVAKLCSGLVAGFVGGVVYT